MKICLTIPEPQIERSGRSLTIRADAASRRFEATIPQIPGLLDCTKWDGGEIVATSWTGIETVDDLRAALADLLLWTASFRLAHACQVRADGSV